MYRREHPERRTAMFRPEPLTRQSLTECLHLLASFPYKPYAHYSSRVGEPAVHGLFLRRVEANLEQATQLAFWIPGGEGGLGMAALDLLGWDSQQLGFAAARIPYLIALGSSPNQHAVREALLLALLRACSDNGVRHVTARIDAADLTTAHVLERHGFITVDGILTFSRDAQGTSPPSVASDLEIRESQRGDLDSIKDIARSSYSHDRFHSDPRIPGPVADELHATWLENCCLGKAADAVIVALSNGSVLGFASCKIDHETGQHLGLTVGSIGLVATVAEARRKGIARALTSGSLAWFRDQSADVVEVGTQLSNIPASRLYAACGFDIVASHLTMRKWID